MALIIVLAEIITAIQKARACWRCLSLRNICQERASDSEEKCSCACISCILRAALANEAYRSAKLCDEAYRALAMKR